MKIKKLLLAVTAIIAFAMTVTAQTIPSYIPTNGLVGYWPFNGNANDESGNGNHGTVNGATLTTDRNGVAGKAYSFNGISKITVQHSNSLIVGNEMTLSVWFKKNILGNTNDFNCIIQKGTGGGCLTTGYNIAIDYGGGSVPNGVKGMGYGNHNCAGIGSDTALNSSWHSMIIVYAPSTQNKLYIDGIRIYNPNWSACGTCTISNSFTPLIIGAIYSANGGYNWNGTLDDIAIYNRALTQTEITQLYTNCVATSSTTNLTIPSSSLPYTWNGLTFNAAGSQTKHLTNAGGCDSTATLNLTVINTALPSYLPANGLVGWWPFNGNANDESGNGNHGTVNGATLTSDRNGITSKSYYFNGSNNFIKVLNSQSLSNLKDSLTISGWISSAGTFASLVCKSDILGNDGDFRFFVNDNSTALFSVLGYKFFVLQNAFITANNWMFYAITFTNNTAKLFINGQLVSISNSYNNQQGYNNNSDLFFGRDPWGADEFTKGSLDDIAIYNRALTQAEISALYQNTIKLNLTTFLEGSYTGSSMTATPNKINASISNSIADSIIVELHESTSPYATMYSSNGVLNTNGTAAIAFPNSAIGNSYYIAIKHRNSIETWSAAPVAISNHTIYNFTTSASQAYGNNLSNMGDGVFGMYSGDINQDGSIDFSDYPDLDIANNSGVLGYNVNDLNGDASVDFNDYPLLDINSNNGIIAMRP